MNDEIIFLLEELKEIISQSMNDEDTDYLNVALEIINEYLDREES
tara:strand:+ start:888 stop:1022 length:135 start_codon:yes stop_codon:yes gene_type:complete